MASHIRESPALLTSCPVCSDVKPPSLGAVAFALCIRIRRKRERGISKWCPGLTSTCTYLAGLSL
eukprot:scaffold154329_cov22-Tisochrysis_lutea.AAC.2